MRFWLFCGIIVIEKDKWRAAIMAGTLILMMGIHGSGKSTFCELFLADGYNTVETCDEAIAALSNGEDVILDADRKSVV